MNRAFLSLLCGLALTSGAFAEAETSPNEGTRLTFTLNQTPDCLGTYTMSFLSKLGRYYFIQYSEDLAIWSYFPNANGAGDGNTFNYCFSVSGPDRFFLRLKYLPSYTGDPLDQDFDGDKVNTRDELSAGTDPFGFPPADTDGDNMPNDWEIHFGLNPNNPGDATTGPASDPDGDGIPNRTEFQNGTDPTDYYNGTNYPTIQAIGWPVPGPTDEPGTLLPQPFVVEVRDGNGPLNNVRVTFFTEGASAGQVSPTANGAGLATILHLQTGPNGRAQVYFKHPSANPPAPTDRFITAKVGSAVPSGTGPVAVVGAITQENYIYPANTVGRSATEAIDNRINPIALVNVEDAKRVFSVQDHDAQPNPIYIRNTASWCYDLRQQMTCISPWNANTSSSLSPKGATGAGTAFTAQHIITTAHYEMQVETPIRFITADNQVVDRFIWGRKRHPGYETNIAYQDLTVYTLNAPLPASITPCKILPANYATYLSYLDGGRPPVMILDQEE